VDQYHIEPALLRVKEQALERDPCIEPSGERLALYNRNKLRHGLLDVYLHTAVTKSMATPHWNVIDGLIS
jgi:hypothetical protein